MEKSMEFDGESFKFISKLFGTVLLIVTILIGGTFAVTGGYAQYKIYLKELEGKAKLAEAEFEKRIVVEEARAKRDSAKMLAEAEVERAKGVAQANAIIGKSLEGNESYLRYLWIQGLQDGSSEVIYIPTEGNMPILEAGRFQKRGK